MMLPLSMIGLLVVGGVIGAGVYHLLTNVTLNKGKRK